ncbi:hypothetical protein S83_042394, partial [Arachis hypogaea]
SYAVCARDPLGWKLYTVFHCLWVALVLVEITALLCLWGALVQSAAALGVGARCFTVAGGGFWIASLKICLGDYDTA